MKKKCKEGVRLDKWLWAARFYKTRALAREMIQSGKVHYNGQRSKPGKLVEPEAELRLRQGSDQRTVIIQVISDQRGSANEALQLYTETQQSIEKRQEIALTRKINMLTLPHSQGRPDKKMRREWIKFKYSGNQ